MHRFTFMLRRYGKKENDRFVLFAVEITTNCGDIEKEEFFWFVVSCSFMM